MKNEMTLKDAVNVLDEATNSVKTDRRGHALILQALDILRKFIEEQESNGRSETKSNT